HPVASLRPRRRASDGDNLSDGPDPVRMAESHPTTLVTPDDALRAAPEAGASVGAEGLYARLFDLSPFPAVVSRVRDNVVVAVNAHASELIGIPQEEAVGVNVADYYVNPRSEEHTSELQSRENLVCRLLLEKKKKKKKKK